MVSAIFPKKIKGAKIKSDFCALDSFRIPCYARDSSVLPVKDAVWYATAPLLIIQSDQFA